MAALKTLFGWLAILFHLLFCVASASLGAYALAAGARRLHLEILPWTGAQLTYILLFGGLFGLCSVALAAFGRVRFLFLFWSVAVASVLSNHLLFSNYRFYAVEWREAVYLTAAAWLAVVGAMFVLFAKPARGPRKYKVK